MKAQQKMAWVVGEKLQLLIQDRKEKLSEQQVNNFFEHGYLIIPNFFNKQEVEKAINSASRLQNEAEKLAKMGTGKIMHNGTQFVIDKVNDKVQIHRIVWAGAAEPDLLRLSRQPKLLVPIAQLLGSSKADHLIDQIHYKLPKDGVSFAWHQDSQNRRRFDEKWEDVNGNGSFVQAIIALDEMSTENGTIFIVPDSNKQGDIHLDLMTDLAEVRSKTDIDHSVPLELQPGDLVLMHPLLVHGSKPNESSKPRRILINGFAYPGANKEPYPGEGSALEIDLL